MGKGDELCDSEELYTAEKITDSVKQFKNCNLITNTNVICPLSLAHISCTRNTNNFSFLLNNSTQSKASRYRTKKILDVFSKIIRIIEVTLVLIDEQSTVSAESMSSEYYA
jgi:hypothetical protein